jgi:hypothetical protein
MDGLNGFIGLINPDIFAKIESKKVYLNKRGGLRHLMTTIEVADNSCCNVNRQHLSSFIRLHDYHLITVRLLTPPNINYKDISWICPTPLEPCSALAHLQTFN